MGTLDARAPLQKEVKITDAVRRDQYYINMKHTNAMLVADIFRNCITSPKWRTLSTANAINSKKKGRFPSSLLPHCKAE